MVKKYCYFLIIILLVHGVYAIEPIERQEETIIKQHEITRDYFEEYTNMYLNYTHNEVINTKNQLLLDYKKIMWHDRLMTWLGVFLVVVIGFSLKHILYLMELRKYKKMVDKYTYSKELEIRQNQLKSVDKQVSINPESVD